MPRERRSFKRYSLYHVYNRGNRKQVIFRSVDDYEFFIFKTMELSSKYTLQIKGYCLMDNHYHLLIKTGSDPKVISKFMQRLSTSFSLYTNKKYDLVGHVFQGRFRSSLINTKWYEKKIIRYFKKNPVEAKYVRVWHQYKWLYISDDLL